MIDAKRILQRFFYVLLCYMLINKKILTVKILLDNNEKGNLIYSSNIK